MNMPPPADVTSGVSVPLAEFPGVVQELRPAPQAIDLFPRFANRKHCLFLDSALRHPTLGRFSYLAADPVETIIAGPESAACAFAELQAKLAGFPRPTIAGLPPFQGGAAGVFCYELGHVWERIPAARFDEFQVPPLVLGLYDVVLAFDHAEERAWLISSGYPETDPAARRERAEARAAGVLALIATPAPAGLPARQSLSQAPLQIEELAPQFPISWVPNLISDFAADDYLAAVARAIEYIRAGDIFQVNLSQRLLHPAVEHAAALYLRLRQCNPATFAGYFDGGEFQLASASPERFLSVQGGEVEARPIKGTRGRHLAPEADLFAGSDLQASDKDRAENVMIVDLLRNDLSRVCTADSVQVTQLCRLENYEYVKHLVSAIRGRLRPECTALDLFPAAFPGGSITGAPKVRAMEIIAELEPTARGPYCGSLGYLGLDGSMDTSILIRTITAARGWWQASVGGGIVARSTPANEYEETWHKAAGLIQAMRGAGR